MKKLRYIAVFALAVLTFASVSTAAEKMSQSAFDELLKKVEAGDAEAQYILGGMCYVGKSVKQDYEQAVYWFKKAAEQGHVKAQYILGSMYDEGKDVKQDYEQAVEWYRKAAEQGYAEAQFSLGLMYDVGKGVKQDDEKAKYWYSKAVENGLEGAKLPLAVIEFAEQDKKAKQSQTSTRTSELQTKSTLSDVIEATVEDIKKTFDENPFAARRKYAGKKVRVTEKIYLIGTEDFSNKIFVRLSYKDASDFYHSNFDDLHCYFDESEAESVMQLKKGQIVTIEGICDNNCYGLEHSRVVNAPQPTSQASEPSVSTENTASQTVETPVYEEHNYKLTDAEYTRMLKNSEFAKADKSLNAAWANARKLMKTKDFEALKQEQSKWISGGRDAEARERMNENMEEKTQAYATVTLARAYYVAHLARGERLMYAIPTGNRVNVRSKPVNGKVLYQVSSDYGDGEGDLLIVDGNPVNGNGENWYKVLYTVSVNEGAAVKANGFIVGRFIRLEPLPILDWRYADN